MNSLKMEVSENREIVIRLDKQTAARLQEEMDELYPHGAIIPVGSPFDCIRKKLVDALYQAMKEENYVGPV